MYDDIDRMQLELTDLDFAIRTSIDDYAEQEQKLANRMQLELTDLDYFAIRTSIDDYAEQEQKLAYEHSNLSSLKSDPTLNLLGVEEKEKRNVQFLQIKQQYMASSPWLV